AKATSQSFTTATNIAYEALSEEQRWDAKLTAEILPRHSVIASYTNTLLAEQNATDMRGSGRVVDLDALIPDRSQPVNLRALTYEGIASSKTFAEIHLSQKRYALRGNGGRSR